MSVFGARSFGSRGLGDNTAQAQASAGPTLISSSDSASGLEAVQGINVSYNLESATGTDGTTFQAAVSGGGEVGSGVEGTTYTITITNVGDSALGADSSNSPGGSPQGTDTATGTEGNPTIRTTDTTASGGTGTEGQSLGILAAAADTGSGSSSQVVGPGNGDTGTGVEAGTVAISVTGGESGTAIDNSALGFATAVRARSGTLIPLATTQGKVDTVQFNAVRHRLGSAVPKATPVGKRTRSGSATPQVHLSVTAIGLRSRGGRMSPVPTMPGSYSGGTPYRTASNAVLTLGSPVVNSPTANFSSSDVGKPISDSLGLIPPGTTILSVSSPATMSSNATGTTSTDTLYIGTPTNGGGGGVGGGGTGGGTVLPVSPIRKWRFDDPVDGSFYLFEINPNTGGSGTAKFNLTTKTTSAPDGKPLVFGGEPDVITSQFSGVFRTKTQYDAFVTWFQKNRILQLTDDLGRVSWIFMTQFQAKRKAVKHAVFRAEATVDYAIYSQVNF